MSFTLEFYHLYLIKLFLVKTFVWPTLKDMSDTLQQVRMVSRGNDEGVMLGYMEKKENLP